MYVLHYAPDNASLIVRLFCEEQAIPYRTELVDRSTRAQDSAGYRRLNPAGLIPALETPDGPMAETGAILLWLTDRHGLWPEPSQRGPFLQWLFYLSNSAHADLRRLFYPGQYAPPGSLPAHHDMAAARMAVHFGLLDAAAARHPDLFAPGTVPACYAGALLRWSALYPRGGTGWFALDRWPALLALAQALDARPATRRVALAEGLGDRPFSAPIPPTPPEGSVL
ncbi:MAG: glutathione S-transferase family protein [Gemmobacter sp.]